ncbi:hypothetical protein ACG5V6_15540 [Streptomyces chitinivorans]|uniref:DUF2975 domain-containing protein n=1 Tax=Streptomyces chitinivorans TaxID=1257027 RepID=A0ABW7HW57_9ACTN|nr:hypothetical protein [Streptomyces chitinivorans]MDH2408954.1 hypothetical protein [Streptomyces chitinivorans]
MIRMRRLAAVAAILLVICQALFVAFFAFVLLPGWNDALGPLDKPVEETGAGNMRLYALGAAFVAMCGWMCWVLARSMRSGHSNGRSLAVCALLEAVLLAYAVYRMEPMSASGAAVTLLLILLCRPRGSEAGSRAEPATASPPGAGTSAAGPGQVV